MEPEKQNITPQSALVLEDDEPCQIIMTHYLKKLNYQVDLVDEGQKAVKMAQEKRYDLIISDVRNKGISGDEVIPLIRKTINSDTVIIVWSAFVNRKNEAIYLNWGADAALTKPCSIPALKMTIAECLEHRQDEKDDTLESMMQYKQWDDFSLSTVITE